MRSLNRVAVSPRFSRGLLAIAALLPALVLAGCAAKRPPPPPAGETLRMPWGSVPTDRWDREADDAFRDNLVESMRARIEQLRAANPGARVPYRVLSISGGGSRGSYGAGVLVGWTDAGDRPEFDVVTGISTGALMATAAFLGTEHDDDLRIYTEINNDDVFHKRGILSIFQDDALLDTKPLRDLIARTIDAETLALVAREHARGRRLFVGTTNLDAQAFVVWDMGAIAASDHPDKLERYRDVVLASASYPMAFPPVYIPVSSDGQTWYQMHVDGGVRETVFFYDFIDEYGEALEQLGMDASSVHPELYLLNNGTLYARDVTKPVGGSTISIGLASFGSLMRKAALSSLYRLWVLALRGGADFHISFIPPDFELSENPLEFDPEEMRRLFELGEGRSRRGEAWGVQPAPRSQQELLELIDPRKTIDQLEARPWLEEGVE